MNDAEREHAQELIDRRNGFVRAYELLGTQIDALDAEIAEVCDTPSKVVESGLSTLRRPPATSPGDVRPHSLGPDIG